MIDGAIDESGVACREGRFGVTRRDETPRIDSIDSAETGARELVHGNFDLRRALMGFVYPNWVQHRADFGSKLGFLSVPLL